MTMWFKGQPETFVVCIHGIRRSLSLAPSALGITRHYLVRVAWVSFLCSPSQRHHVYEWKLPLLLCLTEQLMPAHGAKPQRQKQHKTMPTPIASPTFSSPPHLAYILSPQSSSMFFIFCQVNR